MLHLTGYDEISHDIEANQFTVIISPVVIHVSSIWRVPDQNGVSQAWYIVERYTILVGNHRYESDAFLSLWLSGRLSIWVAKASTLDIIDFYDTYLG